MTRGRPLVTIYREMAGLYNELAGRVDEAAERAGPVLAKTKAERKPPVVVRPEGESNDLDRARARRTLHATGWTENTR